MNKKISKRKILYDPKSKDPYKLSRTRLENFLDCPRCFYLNLRLGMKQPGGLPFTLNSAVDHLLKKEFDVYRAQKRIHPLMERHGINAIPFQHESLNEWRNNFKGIYYLHEKTKFRVSGAIDDVWIDQEGKISIVDYKATAKKGELSLNEEWHKGWKRQMEVYQWLFRKNGFEVSDMGYFVYCNGNKDKEGLNGKLEFNIEIFPYEGNDQWVEKELFNAKKCLDNDNIPGYSEDCDFCQYQQLAIEVGRKKELTQ